MPPGIFDRDRDRDRGKDTRQRVNDQIRITPIRLIGANGEMLGVVPTAQAMEMAREVQLDLVEVAFQEGKPVCKIMDFGKFKFTQKQKLKDKTKTHHQKLKEIRLRPKTGDHDVETKVGQARKFLEHKDRCWSTSSSRDAKCSTSMRANESSTRSWKSSRTWPRWKSIPRWKESE